MKISFVYLLLILQIVRRINTLSVILHSSNPYCFGMNTNANSDVRVNYAIVGQNDQLVHFYVSLLYQVNFKTKVSYADSPTDVLYQTSNKRENDVIVKTSSSDSKVLLCWRRLDRQIKKVNFNFFVIDPNAQSIAGTDTVQYLSTEIYKAHQIADKVSRNIYLKQDIDKQHFDSKHTHFNPK